MTGVVCASFCIARPPSALLMEPVQASQNFDVSAASPVADRPIADPEAISGLWEAPDGHGGVIDLELRVDAFAPPHAKSLNGIEQRLLDADVFLYRRSQAEIVRDDQNLFESSAPGGVALFEHGRLTVRVPSCGLEVHEVQGEQWSGTMQGAPDSIPASTSRRRKNELGCRHLARESEAGLYLSSRGTGPDGKLPGLVG